MYMTSAKYLHFYFSPMFAFDYKMPGASVTVSALPVLFNRYHLNVIQKI